MVLLPKQTMVLFDYLEWFLVSAVFEALPYFSSSNLVSYKYNIHT